MSTLLLSVLLLFIYYSGTENFYIVKKGEFNILENIQYETCKIGQFSNGSQIDLRFTNFTSEVFNYCQNLNYYCNLSIIKNATAPTNLSLLNYTYYDYSINYSANKFKFNGSFNCN